MLTQYNDYLCELPAFAKFTKATKYKILAASSRLTVPKGWKFNSKNHPKKFCIILNGTFQLTYGKPAENYSGTETSGKNFDVKKLVLGE